MDKILKNISILLKRERLLVVTNILVITLTFLIMGSFITIFALTQTVLRRLEDQAQITVFFKDDFPEKNILTMQSSLKKDERVLEVTYVSKEAAFKIFTDLNKNEPVLLESLTASILPASLEVRATKVGDLAALAGELGKKDGVEEVKFFRDVIENFRRIGLVINIVGAVLVAAFLIISFAVITVALRMTINSKGTELEILKLVGASDAYVQYPLVVQGIFYCLVSSVLATLILVPALLFLLTSSAIADSGLVLLSFVPGLKINVYVYIALLFVLLNLVGILLGYFGSKNAIKKYLKY